MEDNKDIQRWRCAYCGFEHKHSQRPTRCSCRSGYAKHIKLPNEQFPRSSIKRK